MSYHNDKGLEYEIYICDYLNKKTNNYALLWNQIPIETLIMINYVTDSDTLRHRRKIMMENVNFLPDLGCDILLYDGTNYIIVQCKNYTGIIPLNKLNGFYKCLDNTQLHGKLYYNGILSTEVRDTLRNDVLYKNKKFIKINRKHKDESHLILRDYQLDAYNTLKDKQRCILSLPCGCGKTNVCMKIASEWNINIIISPLRLYAKQNLYRFTSYLGVDGLLIDSEGTRDIDDIRTFINNNDNCVLSFTFKSCDILSQLIQLLETLRTKIYIDEYHNLSYHNLTNKNDYINKILMSNLRIIFISATPKIFDLDDKNIDINDIEIINTVVEQIDYENEDIIIENIVDNKQVEYIESKENNYIESKDNNKGDEEDDEDDEEDDDYEEDDDIELIDLKTLIFGNTIYKYNFREAINNKYITNYKLYIPDINNITNVDDVFNEAYNIIGEEINIKEYNKDHILKAFYILNGLSRYGYFKCIVYCNNINSVNELYEHLLKVNEYYNLTLNVGIITTKVSVNERTNILDTFKSFNGYSLILSVKILDECIDIVECDSIYITSCFNSKIKTIQRMCRANRIFKNKRNSGIFIWSTEGVVDNIISSLKEYDDIGEIVKNIIITDSNIKYTRENIIANKQLNETYTYYKNNFVVECKEYNDMWYVRYEEYLNFLRNNDRKPLRRIEREYQLNRWNEKQRYNYKYNKGSMLDKYKRELYEQLINEFKHLYILLSWNDKYNLLDNYITNNNVRPNKNTNKQLSNWYYSTDKKYNNKQLSEERHIKFEALKLKHENILMTDEEKWHFKYNICDIFLEKYNRKPYEHNKNEKQLFNWIKHSLECKDNRTGMLKEDDKHDLFIIMYNKYIHLLCTDNDLWYKRYNDYINYINLYNQRPTASNNNHEIHLAAKWYNKNKGYYNDYCNKKIDNKHMKNQEKRELFKQLKDRQFD